MRGFTAGLHFRLQCRLHFRHLQNPLTRLPVRRFRRASAAPHEADEPEGPDRYSGGEPSISLGSLTLSAADVDAIARVVVERLSDRVVREIAWDVVPDLAEVIVRERIRELEREGPKSS